MVVVVAAGCVTVVSRVCVVVEVTGRSEAQEVRRIAPKETTAIRRMDFFIIRFDIYCQEQFAANFFHGSIRVSTYGLRDRHLAAQFARRINTVDDFHQGDGLLGVVDRFRIAGDRF